MISKGAIKLISIIRAIVQSPSILLLDEPMVSLDSDSQARLLSLLTTLKGDMTIIAASYFDELSKISDKTITLENSLNTDEEKNTTVTEVKGALNE